MSTASRSNEVNALMLRWHAAMSTVGYEAFQSWGLTTLHRHLRFDGALWGALTLPDAASDAQASILGAHLYRLPSAVVEQLEEVRRVEFAAKRPVGSGMTVSIADAKWKAPTHAVLRAHALRHGLMNSVSIRFAEAQSSAQQFIMLVRHGDRDRFAAGEVREFEQLAPHLMQAYANRRKLFLDNLQVPGRRSPGIAVALIDRGGVVHDAHPRFLTMIRREWSDWPGKRLPEALLDLNSRWAGRRWTFLGAQISADFAPVEDLYLVTARPRHASDVLTSREGEVAQRYASGDSFRQIAESLNLAPATVRSHLRNVFGKLQIRNKSQLAASLR